MFIVVSLVVRVPQHRLLEKWDLTWGWSAQRTSLLRGFLRFRPSEGSLLRTVVERHGVYICLWWLIAVVPWNCCWLVPGLTFRPLYTNFRSELRAAAVRSRTVTAGEVLGLFLFNFSSLYRGKFLFSASLSFKILQVMHGLLKKNKVWVNQIVPPRWKCTVLTYGFSRFVESVSSKLRC